MKTKILFEGSDPSKTQSVQAVVMKMNSSRNANSQTKPEVAFLHGSKNMSSFDNFGPVLLGFLIFFFTFLLAGIAFIRERTTGTLEKMMTTPLRRWELVCGYAVGFSLLFLVQSTIITLVSVYLLD